MHEIDLLWRIAEVAAPDAFAKNADFSGDAVGQRLQIIVEDFNLNTFDRMTDRKSAVGKRSRIVTPVIRRADSCFGKGRRCCRS